MVFGISNAISTSTWCEGGQCFIEKIAIYPSNLVSEITRKPTFFFKIGQSTVD